VAAPPPPVDAGGPSLLTRIVLLVISVLWAFPVGLIIGFVYLTKREPGNRAFGRQVLLVMAVYFLLACMVAGFLSAVGGTSGT
jgi:hypothetical protein